MKRSILNGRMATESPKSDCQTVRRSPPLSLRYTELRKLITFSAVSIECNGESKVNTGAKHAFTLSFNFSFTVSTPLTQGFADRRPVAAWHSGARHGDEERAVATPLFHGQTVPSAVPVPRGFASLQSRHRPFSVPFTRSLSIT